MKYVFALAVGSLFASSASADQPTVAPSPTPVVSSPAPIMVTAMPATQLVATSSSTTSTRRGLFGRLRSRGTTGTVSAMPVTTAPVTSGTVITNPGTIVPNPTAQPGLAVPAPMPGGMSVAGNPVVVAGGAMPAGGSCSSCGAVAPASCSTCAAAAPAPMTTTCTTCTTTASTGRGGLFGRRYR